MFVCQTSSMDKNLRKTLGRGQALQRVMAQSSASININERNMANYTNEKIMEFLETISERIHTDPPVQTVPPMNVELPDDGEAEEICMSLTEDKQLKNTEQSMPTKARIELKDHSIPKIIPGQFHFNDADFPPL